MLLAFVAGKKYPRVHSSTFARGTNCAALLGGVLTHRTCRPRCPPPLPWPPEWPPPAAPPDAPPPPPRYAHCPPLHGSDQSRGIAKLSSSLGFYFHHVRSTGGATLGFRARARVTCNETVVPFNFARELWSRTDLFDPRSAGSAARRAPFFISGNVGALAFSYLKHALLSRTFASLSRFPPLLTAVIPRHRNNAPLSFTPQATVRPQRKVFTSAVSEPSQMMVRRGDRTQRR